MTDKASTKSAPGDERASPSAGAKPRECQKCGKPATQRAVNGYGYVAERCARHRVITVEA